MSKLNRRSFIAAGGAIAAAPHLAWGQDATATPAASPAAAPALEGTPDANGYYPSGNPAVPDAWTKAPAELKKMYDKAPGNGGDVSVLIMTYNPPPTDHDKNPWWKELETRLNVKWNPVITPQASYGEKLSALIASGDMPDLFYLNPGQTTVPVMKYVVEGAFLELNEYLDGDKINDYPNLKAMGEDRWKSSTTNGKIYGVPNPQRGVPQLPYVRSDWMQTLLGHEPTNAQEVHDLLVGMSTKDPDGNGDDDTWGLAPYSAYWSFGLMQNMFNVPNGWRVNDDGSFVAAHETDEWLEYLEYTRKLHEDGAYHPDAVNLEFDGSLSMFLSGRSGMFTDGWRIYGPDGYLVTLKKAVPEADLSYLMIPGKDGGTGVGYMGSGTFGFTAIPASVTDPERVKELLRIMDYLSAPYGTEEYNFLQYGIEGIHHEVNEAGFPVINDQYMADWGQLTSYIGGPLPVHVYADSPELGPMMTDLDNKAYSIGILDPSENLYSPTALTDGAAYGNKINDVATDYILGRKDMDAVKAQVADWKERVGDAVRKEFEEAYAKNN